jgi:hypothetical protein
MIDKAVYTLYGLPPEDIKIIERGMNGAVLLLRAFGLLRPYQGYAGGKKFLYDI